MIPWSDHTQLKTDKHKQTQTQTTQTCSIVIPYFRLDSPMGFSWSLLKDTFWLSTQRIIDGRFCPTLMFSQGCPVPPHWCSSTLKYPKEQSGLHWSSSPWLSPWPAPCPPCGSTRSSASMLGNGRMKISLMFVTAKSEPTLTQPTSCRKYFEIRNKTCVFFLLGKRADCSVLAQLLFSSSLTTSSQFSSWFGAPDTDACAWHRSRRMASGSFRQETKIWTRELLWSPSSVFLFISSKQFHTAMKCSQLHLCR